jgi:radical SAM protein with 4Fe4S-binding SPASM domain
LNNSIEDTVEEANSSNKEEENQKICKHCEYYGCLGECQKQIKIQNQNIEVEDRG